MSKMKTKKLIEEIKEILSEFRGYAVAREEDVDDDTWDDRQKAVDEIIQHLLEYRELRELVRVYIVEGMGTMEELYNYLDVT